MKKMPTLDELLADVRRRPALYLDEETLPCLAAFIHGFMCAGTPPSPLHSDFANFKEWLLERFELRSPSAHSWTQILRFYSRNDNEAFVLFWDLFDEFRARDSATQPG